MPALLVLQMAFARRRCFPTVFNSPLIKRGSGQSKSFQESIEHLLNPEFGGFAGRRTGTPFESRRRSRSSESDMASLMVPLAYLLSPPFSAGVRSHGVGALPVMVCLRGRSIKDIGCSSQRSGQLSDSVLGQSSNEQVDVNRATIAKVIDARLLVLWPDKFAGNLLDCIVGGVQIWCNTLVRAGGCRIVAGF